ncbi:MAG: exopolysaccharide biosynthesis polyprenyl glycosylphosphotransferase [Chloroflexi bacterium]|nr:exopolysaccharide biosynthesis polyprenyl glycosylphosphotransferase [Chloroflexota bacterium]
MEVTVAEWGLVGSATESKLDSRAAQTDSISRVRLVLPLAVVDILTLTAGYFLYRLFGGANVMLGGAAGTSGYLVPAVAFAALAISSLWILRVREVSSGAGLAGIILRGVGAVSFAFMATVVLVSIIAPSAYDIGSLALLWVLAIVLLPASEFVAKGSFRLARSIRRKTSVVILGDSKLAPVLETRFGGFRSMTLIEDNGFAGNGNTGDSTAIEEMDSLPELLGGRILGDERVLLAVPADKYPYVKALVGARNGSAKNIGLVVYPAANGHSIDDYEQGRWRSRTFSWRYEKIKRLTDLIIAGSSLLIAAPLMGLIAALIKLDSPGPVFFSQARVGRRGEVFDMIKFRSMRQDAESLLESLEDQNEASGHMFKMADDPRITRVGKWLRRMSLDELPQLINVMQGTMSIIGPRPPLPHEVRNYKLWHFERLDAAPGITGLWQVVRGEEIDFDEMVRLDIEYMDGWSLQKDIKILMMTVPAMLRGEGAY